MSVTIEVPGDEIACVNDALNNNLERNIKKLKHLFIEAYLHPALESIQYNIDVLCDGCHNNLCKHLREHICTKPPSDVLEENAESVYEGLADKDAPWKAFVMKVSNSDASRRSIVEFLTTYKFRRVMFVELAQGIAYSMRMLCPWPINVYDDATEGEDQIDN